MQVLVPHPEFSIFDYSFPTQALSHSNNGADSAAANCASASAFTPTDMREVRVPLDTAILGACLVLENASCAAVSMSPLEIEVSVVQHKVHQVRTAVDVAANLDVWNSVSSSGNEGMYGECSCRHCSYDPLDVTSIISDCTAAARSSSSGSCKSGECKCENCFCFLHASSVILAPPAASNAPAHAHAPASASAPSYVTVPHVQYFDIKRHMCEVHRMKTTIYSQQLANAFTLLQDATLYMLGEQKLDVLNIIRNYERQLGEVVGDSAAHR